MDRALRDFIARKMEDGRRGGRRDRRDYRYGTDNHGTHGTYYVEGEYERDHRDSGYGGRHMSDYEDREDRRSDRRRDYEDEADYGSGEMRLTKHDIKRWKGMLENSDGTRGPHFEMVHILTAADKLGVSFKDYDEKEFCMTVNMMYADYGEVIKKYASGEKELHCCVDLAKAFLEDADGPEPSEKLALYYHCIVDA